MVSDHFQSPFREVDTLRPVASKLSEGIFSEEWIVLHREVKHICMNTVDISRVSRCTDCSARTFKEFLVESIKKTEHGVEHG